ncbi:hypothetical protein HerbRD11066_63020 [Herbidospora sp. RD11066]
MAHAVGTARTPVTAASRMAKAKTIGAASHAGNAVAAKLSTGPGKGGKKVTKKALAKKSGKKAGKKA